MPGLDQTWHVFIEKQNIDQRRASNFAEMTNGSQT